MLASPSQGLPAVSVTVRHGRDLARQRRCGRARGQCNGLTWRAAADPVRVSTPRPMFNVKWLEVDGLAIELSHTRCVVRTNPLESADARIVELADEVESSHGRVVFTRDGEPVAALLSADELESIEATLWWYQDAAERAARGERPGEGENGPGLDEAQARALYDDLVRRSTA